MSALCASRVRGEDARVEALAWDYPLPGRPRRVLVTGTSGAGKTTLAHAAG